MKCPACDTYLERIRTGDDDDKRNTYLRLRVCPECGTRLVSADVFFPEDRQAEELHRLYSLRYARRAKPRRAQHT